MPVGDIYFRYDDYRNEDVPPTVQLATFKVVRETEACVFLESLPFPDNKPRRALKNARVSWAYPTIELARNSFTIRKKRQLGYISRTFNHVTEVLAMVEDGTAWDYGAQKKGWLDTFTVFEKKG